MEQSEKKKRWRPSLTAYRQLEKELAEAKENNRLILLELKRQKQEFEAYKGKGVASQADNGLSREVERLNGVIEERDKELASVRETVATVRELNNSLADEIEYMRNRGFFARLFNKI